MKKAENMSLDGQKEYCVAETAVSNKDTMHILLYIFATAFVALFGAIYELFSHEVYSYYMIYAFAIPLFLGVIPEIIVMTAGKKRYYENAQIVWNCGVAALTIGSIFQGILDIYGTTNKLIIVYPVAGFTMLAVGIIVALKKKRDLML